VRISLRHGLGFSWFRQLQFRIPPPPHGGCMLPVVVAAGAIIYSAVFPHHRTGGVCVPVSCGRCLWCYRSHWHLKYGVILVHIMGTTSFASPYWLHCVSGVQGCEAGGGGDVLSRMPDDHVVVYPWLATWAANLCSGPNRIKFAPVKQSSL